jgi:multicomponent K+:H+ antiporter subunit G
MPLPTPSLALALEALAALLLLAGGAFALIGSIGLVRLADFPMRLHAPTKASTLGVGSVLIATLLLTWQRDGAPGLNALLITFFVFLSAPVSSHLLMQAWLGQGESSPDQPT